MVNPPKMRTTPDPCSKFHNLRNRIAGPCQGGVRHPLAAMTTAAGNGPAAPETWHSARRLRALQIGQTVLYYRSSGNGMCRLGTGVMVATLLTAAGCSSYHAL